MYDEVLSERIAFRLTPEVRRKLALWAREEHRTLANLVFALVYLRITGGRAAVSRGSSGEISGKSS